MKKLLLLFFALQVNAQSLDFGDTEYTTFSVTIERELLKHKEFLAKIQEEFEQHSKELAKGIEVVL